MSKIETYEPEIQKTEQGLEFLFVSAGNRDIIKVVQYSYVQQLFDKDVYNLGFGDYDVSNDFITDSVNSNNKDAYKVFNTVLNTIPIFFENYPKGILMVQGSDGRPEFINNCKLSCSKNCVGECKNFNRRINVYRGYVNKNYEALAVDYQFFGGGIDSHQVPYFEEFVKHKNYDSVLLFKRNP